MFSLFSVVSGWSALAADEQRFDVKRRVLVVE
jgi:hypothetical protein